MKMIYELLDKTWFRSLLLIPGYLIFSGVVMDVWLNVTIKGMYPYEPKYPVENLILMSGFWIAFCVIAIYIADNKELKTPINIMARPILLIRTGDIFNAESHLDVRESIMRQTQHEYHVILLSVTQEDRIHIEVLNPVNADDIDIEELKKMVIESIGKIPIVTDSVVWPTGNIKFDTRK